MKSVVRTVVTFAAIGLFSAVAGTSAHAGQEAAPVADAPPAGHRAHGIIEMIGEALSQVSLRQDQITAVEALGPQLEPIETRLADTESGLTLALADQVEAGHIDKGALQPAVDAYVNARRDVAGDVHSAIERIHAILDPAQRADFADAFESALGQVRHAIVSDERVDDLKQKLDLNDKQVQRIRDILQGLASALEADRQPMTQAVEAFRGDSFSIERYLPLSEVPARALARAERIVDTTAAIADVLDPQQRSKLAETMRRHAEARAGRGKAPAPRKG